MAEWVGQGFSVTESDKEDVVKLLDICHKETYITNSVCVITHGKFRANIYGDYVIWVERTDKTEQKKYEETELPEVGTLLTKWYDQPMIPQCEVGVSRGYMVTRSYVCKGDFISPVGIMYVELTNLDTLETSAEYMKEGSGWLCCLNSIGEPDRKTDPDSYIEHVLKAPVKRTWGSARISPCFSMDVTINKLLMSPFLNSTDNKL